MARLGGARQWFGLLEQGGAGGREGDAVGAAVAGIGAAAQPAARFHGIEHADERAGIEAGALGQLALAAGGLAHQRQQPELARVQAERRQGFGE